MENLLSVAILGTGDYTTASEVFDDLRSVPYITNRGKRGSELNNSRFDELANALFHECEWEPFEIKSRLKHYEGWSQHEWA